MAESLFYVERKPKNNQEHAPLLVLLHGYGSHEQDLFSFAEELPRQLRIISVRAPQSMGFGAYCWYEINFDANENKFSDIGQAKESLQKIDGLIDDLQAKYHPKKTFLLGFSQGAILSYAYSFNYVNKVNHVLALSGFLVDDLLPDHMSSGMTTDYYASHGSADQVIPVEWARKCQPFLKSLGLDCDYSEYPVGHGVAPQNFYSFRDWMGKRL